MPPLGRILVVDDEPHVADVLRDVLIDLGYQAEVAVTGSDALALAPRYRPDAVLLDLFMPGMPGEVALERFREFDPSVPIIVVSGNQDEEVARATLAQGAFDYIKKPFDLVALERVLAAALLERGRRRGR
jgi:CheY-like chemotaxis protein